MTDKHWSEAKMPQWAKDSVSNDLRQYQLTAALSWPTAAKPEPLPFRFGEYDRITGTVSAGSYWTASVGSAWSGVTVKVRPVHIRATTAGWKKWEFSDDGERWSTIVTRGPLFSSEADARLWALWEACTQCAESLMQIRGWGRND